MNTSHNESFRGFEPLDREELSRFCSPESIKHLESSMSALKAGRAPTPSFPLYGKRDISVVEEFLSSISDRPDVPKWMLSYEQSRLKKFGPQGGHAPWDELREDFILYATRPSRCEVDADGLRDMIESYSTGARHPLMMSVDETLSHLISTDKIMERAAGWNTFNLKKTDKEAQRIAKTLARNGDWKYGYAYVFSRYNKLKKRIFMPMPYSSMIVQAQYYVPFLERIQMDLLQKGSKSSFIFWADKVGFDKCFAIIDDLYQVSRAAHPDWIPLFIQRDFEKMDTTTGPSQYSNVFIPVVAGSFGIRKGTREYEKLENAFLFTTQVPIITPDGVLKGSHGTASGAEVTNGGETVCNDDYDRSILRRLSDKFRIKVDYIVVYSGGNGDDGTTLFLVNPSIYNAFFNEYARIAQDVADKRGFRLQADKWFHSDEYGLYCQNMYWIDTYGKIRWAYPAALILNSIMNPEHEYSKRDWDKDYRDLDIIEKLDNGRGLPYYHDLIDYVMKGLKYPLLGASETETKRILSKYDKYRQLQFVAENFNRREFSISNSPTIQYVLSHRG